MLVRDGVISGIIDWGDITSGDPATDLASIWMLLGSPGARRRALDSYGCDQALRARSRAWAVLFGVVLADSGLVNNPRHARAGAATLARVTEDG